jgi:dimethylhistidine N-methyltransferase
LFEAICALPEYYLTRAEAEILAAHAGEIAGAIPGPVRLLELGSGSAEKTRLLIEALLRRQGALHFLPIDISEAALEFSARTLLEHYPALRVTALAGEYGEGLAALGDGWVSREPGTRTLAIFLGSTIGNLDPAGASRLLTQVRQVLSSGDAFLLGADLRKSEEVLVAAYDDPLGVTAAFNKNLLVRINRELGGGFELSRFAHRALYNEQAGRIEMHLEAAESHTVPVRALDLEIPFSRGESIHTENSYKYHRDQLAKLAAEAGFRPRQTWLDSQSRFSVNLLEA